MSTPAEKLSAIRDAVSIAERRLKQLDEKPRLTRAETFERDMTLDCIRRGKALLDSARQNGGG